MLSGTTSVIILTKIILTKANVTDSTDSAVSWIFFKLAATESKIIELWLFQIIKAWVEIHFHNRTMNTNEICKIRYIGFIVGQLIFKPELTLVGQHKWGQSNT